MKHFDIVQSMNEKTVHELNTVPGYTLLILCKQFTVLILCNQCTILILCKQCTVLILCKQCNVLILCKQCNIWILCKLHHCPSNANILVVERHKILSVEGMADPKYNPVNAVSFQETVCWFLQQAFLSKCFTKTEKKNGNSKSSFSHIYKI